jgi:hypothetical protein
MSAMTALREDDVFGRWKTVIVMFVVAGSSSLYAEKSQEAGRLSMRLVVCENAGVEPEILLSAQAEIIRIFYGMGVHVAWLGTSCDPTRAFVPPTSEDPSPGSSDGYFMVVISREPPKDWLSGHSMGLSPVRSGSYRRAYVFYNLVAAFVKTCSPLQSEKTSLGVVLGHVITHELGHLLLPDEGHGHGIMRHRWAYEECKQALWRNLTFLPDQISRIQHELRFQESRHQRQKD